MRKHAVVREWPFAGTLLTWLTRALLSIVVVIFVLMIVVTFAQVVCRYVLGAPLSWSEELARYCFVWIVFLGAVVALRRGALIGVDLLASRFSAGAQGRLRIVCEILMIGFCMLVIYASLPVLEVNQFQSSPANGFRMSVVYSVVPISMGLMIVVILLQRVAGEGRLEP